MSERASMGTWEVEGAQVRMRERERITSILLTDFATKTSYSKTSLELIYIYAMKPLSALQRHFGFAVVLNYN